MKVKYTKELMEEAVKNSFSYAEVCRKIGLKPVGSNYKTVKSKIALYNLDDSHFTGQRWNRGKGLTNCTSIHSLDEIMKEGTIYSSSLLKSRLIKEGLKINKCEKCGCEDSLVLELHHKNRNHFDNRLENLEILCANCHRKEHRENDYLYPKIQNEGERIKRKQNHLTICENCGKEFYSDRLNKIRRFCSRECYNEFISKGNILGGYNISENGISLTKENIEKQMEKCSDITSLGKLLGVSKTTARNYLEKYGLYEKFKSKYDFHAKPVLQYDINNNLIKEWPSITDAEETLHIYSISECCRFKRKSCGGFIWRYKE